MNARERAEAEERRLQQEQVLATQKDAVRRDRNLMLRFPNEAAHTKARESALDDLRRGILNSERRLKEIELERQALTAETEFYKQRTLPGPLKAKIEANDAQFKAQKDVIQTQQDELGRINRLYDAELARLRQLWSGVAAGSDEAPRAKPLR